MIKLFGLPRSLLRSPSFAISRKTLYNERLFPEKLSNEVIKLENNGPCPDIKTSESNYTNKMFSKIM